MYLYTFVYTDSTLIQSANAQTLRKKKQTYFYNINGNLLWIIGQSFKDKRY